MIELKSKTMQAWYGKIPYEYNLKFIHYNLEIWECTRKEFQLLERDIQAVKAEIKDSFLLYFSDIGNLELVSKNTNILSQYAEDIYVRIRNQQEYEAYRQTAKNLNLIVELQDLKRIGFSKDKLVVQIDTVNELPVELLDSLIEHYNIQQILAGQIAYWSSEVSDLLDELVVKFQIDRENQLELEKNCKVTNDIYDVADYKRMVEIMNFITSGVTGSKEEKFRTVFYYLAENLCYDDNGVQKTNIENQNLMGPLFHRLGVCEGFSKLLWQICSLLEIEAVVIGGGGGKAEGGHIWNQVFLRGAWYNADLSFQRWSIQENLGKEYCLVADDKIESQSSMASCHECRKDYSE